MRNIRFNFQKGFESVYYGREIIENLIPVFISLLHQQIIAGEFSIRM